MYVAGILGTAFDLAQVKTILGSFGALFADFGKKKQTGQQLIMERNGRKFGPRIICGMNMCTFDLEHVKVILGSYEAYEV